IVVQKLLSVLEFFFLFSFMSLRIIRSDKEYININLRKFVNEKNDKIISQLLLLREDKPRILFIDIFLLIFLVGRISVIILMNKINVVDIFIGLVIEINKQGRIFCQVRMVKNDIIFIFIEEIIFIYQE